MVKIPLMVVKPVLKKVIKAVDKGRKDVRKFRKDKEKESSPSTTALNKAQERLETLRDVKDVTLKVLKKKLPKEAMTSLKKTFEDAAKKRATIRNIMADPKKLKRKPNFKGGLIKKPRLAKRGF
jgi:glutamine synthetase type III